MTKKDIEAVVKKQRAWYEKGYTHDIKIRRRALLKLRRKIREYEPKILAALKADLNKSETESFMCEVGLTLSELSFMLKHMHRYARVKPVITPLAQFHAKSFTIREPFGSVLIISPWNYPFLLTMEPLIGALAGGNACVVKPSAYAPHVAKVIKELLESCFPPEYVAVITGGRSENKALLDQRFDYIFFTGSVSVGKEVMKKAAAHLTPVTLELGGKSPCIIDESANLKLAAKRIAFGKVLNSGQTCVAPDYVLIDKRVKDDFLEYLKFYLDKMCKDPSSNEQYVHMINDKHFNRVMGLIDKEAILYGGTYDETTRMIAPTVVECKGGKEPIMQEEIFGPVLPILTFSKISEAMRFVNARPRPLALYLFTESKKVKANVLTFVPFGGGCINDTIIHLATSYMGFGGVGESGMGAYHGKKSFETFTHEKSIVDKSTWMDLPVRYAPYKEWQDKLLRLFLR